MLETQREGLERIFKPLDRIIDSETFPPVQLAAIAGLAVFATVAAGIEAARTLAESLGNRE